MKSQTFLLFAVALAMCNSPKQETVEADNTTFQQKDTVAPESASIEEEAAPTPALVSKSFEEIPIQLQEFMAAVQDPAKLANYINAEAGCYIISEGAGIYPMITEVKTIDDLNTSKEFTLFTNTPKLENGYYIDAELGPCDSSIEGIFFVGASKDDSKILVETHKTYLSATGDELTAEMKTKLEALDASLIWYGDVNLPSKSGELNEFGFLLGLIDNKLCITAIDTRGCGL